jgi:preprotein translocase subunit SecE
MKLNFKEIRMAKTSPILFIRQVRQEISKVSWPTRKETIVTSIMVFIISIIAALFFLAADGIIAGIIGLILK